MAGHSTHRVVRRSIALLLQLVVAVAVWSAVPVRAQEAAPVDPGQRIYRQGILPNGEPLRGTREAAGRVEGADAACANCHRRSGFGTAEGTIAIPPIIGPYLFRSYEDTAQDMAVPHFPGYKIRRPAYDDASLARAIRRGVATDGRELDALMPRFDLDDASMAALVAHLRGLSAAPVPGTAADTLHFATVIAPDADPSAARAMVEILERYFADHNQSVGMAGRSGAHSKDFVYRVERAWRLHVWNLSGAPDRWENELRDKLRREPVFALVAGLGRTTWAPVHHFCELEGIPCLLPIVDLPVDRESDFYSIYFSRGVLLEARLIARALAQQRSEGMPKRVVQIARSDDIGREASAALRAAAESSGIVVVDRTLSAQAGAVEIGAAVAAAGPGDALVLWLREADVPHLPADPPPSVAVYFSGLMAGLERARVPPAWRTDARVAYPMELPERRRVNMNYPFGWMKGRHIVPTSEWVQVHTYLVCQVLSDALLEMFDGYVRDYLVERVEVMLSHRLATAYYPRLSLAPGQRFASKGGYIVRFEAEQGAKVVPDSNWTVP